MQEFRHFELGAGIVANAQLRRAHDDWGVVSAGELTAFRSGDVDQEAVLAAARRLQENVQFVAWLPIAHEMQLEQAQVNQRRLEKATDLLTILEKLQIDGSGYSVTKHSAAGTPGSVDVQKDQWEIP